MSLDEYIQRGVYAIMRQCPTAHIMLGYESIWEVSSTQFKWIIENLSEEFKPAKEDKKIKIN